MNTGTGHQARNGIDKESITTEAGEMVGPCMIIIEMLGSNGICYLCRFAPLNKTKLNSILANIDEATKLLAAGK